MRRGLMLVVAGAVGGSLLAGGAAWAAFQAIGSGGVIQGCYDNGGNLKVVASLPCPKGYTGLQWNQQGPAGQDGAPGVSGREVIHETTLPGRGVAFDFLHCPDGKVPTGGGAAVAGAAQDSTGSVSLIRSAPTDDGWAALALQSNGYAGVWELVTYVICATAN